MKEFQTNNEDKRTKVKMKSSQDKDSGKESVEKGCQNEDKKHGEKAREKTQTNNETKRRREKLKVEMKMKTVKWRNQRGEKTLFGDCQNEEKKTNQLQIKGKRRMK